MNQTEALAFLRSHQPLPSDRELTQEIIQKYDQIRKFFIINPDPDCIQLFLNSFGDGDGLGVYQLVGDVFRNLQNSKVIEELSKSLKSAHRSVRYWSVQLAAEFPSPEFTPQLFTILKEDDHDLKYATLTAIEQSAQGDEAISKLLNFSSQEPDEELRVLAEEVVESLREKSSA